MKDINLDDYEAVIFDLDGSLVDSMWMWKAIDIEYLAGHGIEAPSTLQKDIGGRSFVETAIYFKERFGLSDSIEKIGDDWNKMAWEKYTNEVPLKEGVSRLLDKCEQNGIKLGIASSNSTELIKQVLSSHGIMDKFNSIKSGTEVVKGKRTALTFRTSGAPAAIQFVPVNSGRPADSTIISSSHNDLAYVYLRVVDADGNLCPTAEIPLDIKTSGVRHLAVAGTGHPYDVRSFRSLKPTTFRGQALLIIQPQDEKGVVNITTSSPKFNAKGTFNVVME